jgi:hypothetical protein
VRRYLIIALVVAFSVLSPVTNGNSAEQNPKFTLIFERAKAISCSKDQSNILIDFTNYYTANYHRQIDSNIQCQFSISPSTQNFAVSKDNGLLRVHPQIFENNTWIRAAKSQLNIGGAEAWGYPQLDFRMLTHLSVTNIKPKVTVTSSDLRLDLSVLNKHQDH